MAFTSDWNPAVNEGDRAFAHERDVEVDEDDAPAQSHDEQLIEAIGDTVYELMHGPLCNRDAMTATQRVRLQMTLWAFMNDRLFWAQSYEAVQP